MFLLINQFQLSCEKQSFSSKLGDVALHSVIDSVCRELAGLLTNKISDMLLSREIINSIITSTKTALMGINSFDLLVFPEVERDSIDSILYTVRRTSQSKKKFEWPINVILMGPPGTGKTEVMIYLVRLAIYYCRKNKIEVFPIIISGSKIRSYNNTTAQSVMEKIFMLIKDKMSKKICLIIFAIDEVDPLLYDMQSKRSDVLTSIISNLTIINNMRLNPKVKGNFMLLCTTNLPMAISAPMSRRFEHAIAMDIPSPEEKVKMFKMHMAASMKRTKIKHEISDKFLLYIATQAVNLTGGEIVNIVRMAWFHAHYIGHKHKKNLLVSRSIFFRCFINEYYKRLIFVDKKMEFAESEKARLLKILERVKKVERESKTSASSQAPQGVAPMSFSAVGADNQPQAPGKKRPISSSAVAPSSPDQPVSESNSEKVVDQTGADKVVDNKADANKVDNKADANKVDNKTDANKVDNKADANKVDNKADANKVDNKDGTDKSKNGKGEVVVDDKPGVGKAGLRGNAGKVKYNREAAAAAA